MNQQNYKEYIDYLRESFSHLSKFPAAVGFNSLSVRRILKDLHNPDPFIMYQASLAASRVLDQDTQYH